MPEIKQANTIVFLSDNHAQSALGCYGEPAIRTPVIDSIANRGLKFENAYCTSPLCCPSRAALATGRYPHQTGYVDNVLVYDGSVPSWMHRARAAGRKVVSVGKLHFRSEEDDNGFTEEHIPMHILNKRGGTSMLLRAAGGEMPATGQWELYTEQFGIGSTVYQQYDRDITRTAIEWLREEGKQPSEAPWILFVSYASPHPPFKVPFHIDQQLNQEDMRLPEAFGPLARSNHPAIAHLRHIMGTRAIDDPDLLRKIRKAYYGLVMHIDRQIGEVLGEAEAQNFEDLRLIYTSDHGEMLGTQGLFGKSCVYQEAMKVPLVMCGPGIPVGQTSTSPVSLVDLYPTLLESSGVPLPSEDQDLPGRSLFHDLPADRPVFAEYHATGTTGGAFVLWKDAFKLIYHVGHPHELFDLEADPHETRNLAGSKEHETRLAEMIEHLKKVCDPETADLEAKRAQAQKVTEFGGRETLLKAGNLVYTPPPGKPPEIRSMS